MKFKQCCVRLMLATMALSPLAAPSFAEETAKPVVKNTLKKDARYASTMGSLGSLYQAGNQIEGPQPEHVQEISKSLKPNSPVTTMAFNQYRYLKLLKRPVVTSGEMIVNNEKKDTELTWRVEKPIASEYLITKGKLYEVKQGKSKALKTGDQPAFTMLADVLNQAMAGSTEMGIEHNLYFAEVDKAWNIGIQPTDPDLKDLVDHITMRGGYQDGKAKLGQIVILDKRQDLSIIELIH